MTEAIEYRVEHRYHFQCPSCRGSWSIGDWSEMERKQGVVTCPYYNCGYTAPTRRKVVDR